MSYRNRSAFTLVELLTLLACTVALVAIALPMVAARRSDISVRISMHNLGRINQGGAMYRADNDGLFPVTLTYQRKWYPTQQWPTPVGWCQWQFGGRNNHGDWGRGETIINGQPYSLYTGFDVEAADRPLTPYVHPELAWVDPPLDQFLDPDDPSRDDDAPFFYDPGDSFTLQIDYPEPTFERTSYEDVGTSYTINMRWWEQVLDVAGGSFRRAFDSGTRFMRNARTAPPDRFVWISDQMPELLSWGYQQNFTNGHGDVDMSMLGYADGHVSYELLEFDTFETDRYTFIFQHLDRVKVNATPHDGGG